MKIAELFIALGFKVQGQGAFDTVKGEIKHAAIDATKLTIAVNAVNFALLALMATGTKAAVVLKNFGAQTGLSRGELQKWSHEAEVNDVAADELRATIVGLQDARAAFALGEPQAVGAWSLLGVDPRQDPFKVLDELRARLKGIEDVGVARNLAERVGISSNVFALLRSSNDEFAKWRKNFEVTKQQEDRLIRLNRAWKDLRFNLTAIRIQFAAALAPALSLVARGLAWVTDKIAIFNAWLNSSVAVGRAFRFVLGALAIAFLLAGAAIAVVAAGLAALSAAMVLLSPAFLAVLPLIAEAALTFGVLLGFILAVVLAVDDMIASFTGGKAVTRTIGEWLAEFEAVRWTIEKIIEAWELAVKGFKAGGKIFEDYFGGFFESRDAASQRGLTENRGAAWFAPRNVGRTGGGGGSWNQENNVTIQVDGARSPEATAKAVGRSVADEIKGAAYQLPVPAL